MDIVARNIILLLLVFVTEDLDEAVDCMIHIWYSAFIKESHMNILNERVRPLVEEVCTKIANKSPKTMLGKTWTFGSRTLRLVVRKEEWASLPYYLKRPDGLSMNRAQDIRNSCTMAEERRDYRERKWLSQLPAHRFCEERFRKDGILLPFGHPRDQYSIPNPSVQKEYFSYCPWLAL